MVRKRKAAQHLSTERWLVSYADFITLLFAFFTTMYAISTVDAQKMGRMVMSMRASFDSSFFPAGGDSVSLGSGGGGYGPVPTDIVENIRVSKGASYEARARVLRELKANLYAASDVVGGKNLGALKRAVDTLVSPEAAKGRVRTRLENRGLVISLGEGGFFDSGSDVMKPEGRALLDTIATGLVGSANHLRVEGHTDNVPISNSRFPSNWELSTARATSIVAYLIVKFGFTPDKLSAAGYAEFRPVATNDSVEGRASNRRVDIIVLSPQYAQLEP